MAAVSIEAETVAARVADVRRRVAHAGGDPDEIRIVAVTKGFGPEAVAAAFQAGLVDVGENYAQELVAKASASPPGVRWHFLGTVQRNKVSRLAPLVRVWHGIDRPRAADAVAAATPGAEVFVEVNVTGAPSRSGCAPGEAEALVEHCRAVGLDVAGLMTVGPEGDIDAGRRDFRWLARRARELRLRGLSMGMSDDFEVAVAEGATTLRLGRVLFGPRPGPAVVSR